jgi:hypothetical protein
MLLDVFCGPNSDTRFIQQYSKVFAERIQENDEARPENRIAALRLLKRCVDRDSVVALIDKVCFCIGDEQLAVREAVNNCLQAMYPEQRQFEEDLLQTLSKTEKAHTIMRQDARALAKRRRAAFRRRRGKHAAVVEKLRKRLRVEILGLHDQVRGYEDRITVTMQKYQNLVETMRRERIRRQYQQHEQEIALHDARTSIVDSDASDSDSDDPDRPSATDIVQKMMQEEQAEKNRERERGKVLTDCRMRERVLRSEKDVLLTRLDECHRELKGGEHKFRDNVRLLDLELEDAHRESEEHQWIIMEDLRYKRNVQITNINYHESYRRTLCSFLARHGEKKRDARKEREKHRSKHLGPLPLTPRLTNIFADPIRLSAIHALRSCHTQWKGTYYSKTIDIVAEAGEPNTQIRGAAIELMTFAMGPNDAFRYAPHILHSLQSQCSVLREGATAGARALGAVPLQQAAKFTRGFQGAFGPKVPKGKQTPKIGGYQKRDRYVQPGKLRVSSDLKEIFNMMDLDGNGVLDTSEVITCIKGNTLARRMLEEHPTLKRVLRDELWTEKVFAACDTDVSGSVDFDEFESFVVRAMAGADREFICLYIFFLYGLGCKIKYMQAECMILHVTCYMPVLLSSLFSLLSSFFDSGPKRCLH